MTRRFVASSARGRAGLEQVRAMLRARGDDHDTPLATRRAALAAFAAGAPPPQGVTCEDEALGGVRALRIAPVRSTARTVLYLHGGAYVLGSPQTHKGLAARFAVKTPATVHALDYRLAPEHPYPAALEDAVASAQALGEHAGAFGLLGDSAGGGLALASVVALRDRGMPLPDRLALVSPWVDLALTGASMDACAAVDVMLGRQGLQADAARYRDALPAADPRISPLFADLAGLPPVFIQVGDAEVLYDDAVRLADALAAANVTVTLEIWSDMTHAWAAFPSLIPEADAAVESVAAFLAA